jgi:uncharacterized membrane protein
LIFQKIHKQIILKTIKKEVRRQLKKKLIGIFMFILAGSSFLFSKLYPNIAAISSIQQLNDNIESYTFGKFLATYDITMIFQFLTIVFIIIGMIFLINSRKQEEESEKSS